MAANDTRRLRVVVTGDSGDAQEALEQVGEAADQTESKLMTLTRTLAMWAGRGAIAIGAVGAAAVTMGVSTASQLEQVEVGFTTMLGSAQKAQKFMKELQDFAAATPFEFTELVGSAQRFLAMGFAAKDVIPMLTAVGDAVAAMGGSAESVDAVTRALGQMQAKGKVSGEELMQLTEQGIPALKILADSYGVTTMDMSKMIEKGQVLSDKAIPLLIKGLRDGTANVKGFGGMMEKQSATMQGKWSTFMDTLRMGLGNIATKFLPMMKVGIEVLSKAFSNFFAGLEGKGKLKGFSGTINELGLGIRAFIAALKDGDVTSDGLVGKFELMGAAINGVIAAFRTGTTTSGGWRGVLENIAVVAGKLVAAIKEVVGWISSFAGFLKQNETAAWAFWGALSALLIVTKAHAAVLAVQAAGGMVAMIKNMSLVTSITKVATAVQWAYNGAMVAANYLKFAGGIAILTAAQKVWNGVTKVATAIQWAFNAAWAANPIGLIVLAVAAAVGAIILLWKKSDTFRNFVLNVLWPALKAAWNGIKVAFVAVVDALVAAWNWLKNAFMAAWNAIWGFLKPIITGIVNFFTPLFNVIAKIAQVIWGFYTAAWKIVWILIQVAVKAVIAYFQNLVIPFFMFLFNTIKGHVMFFYNNVWKPIWDGIRWAVKKVTDWITGSVIPTFQRNWQLLKIGVQLLWQAFVQRWNAIKERVQSVISAIVGPISNMLNRGIQTIRNWLTGLKNWWDNLFNGIKSKTSSVMDGVVAAFNKGKDGIKKAWDAIVSTAKAPINFVINEVYNNRIRTLWNKVAEKFGIKTRLDAISGFARGGIIGKGYGTRDDQLALLTRGEGILTTKEMRKLGGPRGFQEFRASLAQYNKGGIVGGDGLGGWISSLANKGKDIFQGIAGMAIKPLVNTLRNFINNNLSRDGFTGLLRSGSNTILDKLVSWVAGKDKEIGAIGGAGGAIGWAAMRNLISARFPGLGMISGFRPGAITVTGNRSYHAMGRAVDYPPVRALAAWIRGTFGAKTKELITPWQDLNLHNGRPHRYTGSVWNTHSFAGGNAHVHWAMDSASVVQPGWFAGYNGTGKPETLVNADLIPQPLEIHIHNHGVGNMSEQDAKKIRNELLRLAGRNGGRTGLPGQ